MITHFVSNFRSFEARSYKSEYVHAAGQSPLPQSAARVRITLRSVKVRLAVSVGDCFCDPWNDALLKLFTIFYVSEGVCFLLLVNSKHC